jgi:thiol-disulfide isomerase/thioredoxin
MSIQRRAGALLGLALFGLAAHPSSAADKPLPREIDGAGLTKLLAEHRGHPLLINFFASWCKPCKDELRDLGRLHARHPDWVLLGIDVDEKILDLQKFLPRLPPKMEVVRSAKGAPSLVPALHLPNDWNESFPPGWEKTLPLSFLFDGKGEFLTGSVGRLSAEAMRGFEEAVKAP